MSAPGGVVLAATLVVSSPIVWLVHEGSLSLEDAVLRWFICLALCRVAISVVSSVAYPSARPSAAPPGTGTPTAQPTGSLTE